MKIKTLILLILGIFALGFFANKTYAQSYKSIPYFDWSKPVSVTSITKSQIAASNVTIFVYPITMITIKKGSFTQDTKVLVYQGIWDKIASLNPKTSTAVSAYYLVFQNSQNQAVEPLKQIQVAVNDNYNFVGSAATLVQLDKNYGLPDSKTILVAKGPSLVTNYLSFENSGFMLVVNEAIGKNDPSLHPPVVTQKPASPTQMVYPAPAATNALKLLLPTFVALIIVVSAICLIFWIIWKKQK